MKDLKYIKVKAVADALYMPRYELSEHGRLVNCPVCGEMCLIGNGIAKCHGCRVEIEALAEPADIANNSDDSPGRLVAGGRDGDETMDGDKWIVTNISASGEYGSVAVEGYKGYLTYHLPIEDARLIAAAPDMLEAIQQAIPAMWSAWSALDHNDYEHEAGNLGDAAKALEAAIAKARGED